MVKNDVHNEQKSSDNSLTEPVTSNKKAQFLWL